MVEKAVMSDAAMLVRNIGNAPYNLDSRRDAPRVEKASYPSIMTAATYMPGA